ncbi:MAG: glycine cleavage system aminomethyltransferase GcvT [Gammaproteobacteria bacterium]|nr:glycine cleavage system aminomethyltransferase GcvT [Gammaproteobacteria bacterium]MDH3467275.1 glycine cleavage system aminomethyltransferase GcvT [Gammaproteobacteria bacterium]
MAKNRLMQTPLYALHCEFSAKMVPFAGFEMPLQYSSGIITEHRHTRAAAGLFDVSHMGQIRLTGTNAAAALETLLPADVMGLAPGRQRYSVFTNEQGGIVDDLMITNAGDHLLLVVNAATKFDDLALLEANIGHRCGIELLDTHALIALQGPLAAQVLELSVADIAQLPFMHAAAVTIGDTACWVSRSGYTGEDGFEISLPAADAADVARRLLQNDAVAPVGLGARDSLRLEAGLCLYGHDIDNNTTPREAGIEFAISKMRRRGGVREGGFPGDNVILDNSAAPVRRRIGIKPLGRAPVREGADLVDAEYRPVGKVTSGSYGPTVEHPVAMGYVNGASALHGTTLNAIVRDKYLAVEVSPLPFVPHRYYRGR